ncbi:MAG TPA: DUF819 family protein [Xanthomonadales bacterium]|nr:DUF819 family protein [Xanthomonadales bacterium]
MSLPLIHADWTLALWAALMFLAALGFWVDKTRLGRNVSGVAVVLATSIALSNLGVLPKSADAYNVVWLYLVPVGVSMLLLKANLRTVLSETGHMLKAFLLGAVGTVIGALLGYWLLPLGENGSKLVGIFSATYIGGSMNMVAVGRALEVDPSVMSASVAADNVVGVMYLAFLAMVPSLALFRRWYRNSRQTAPELQQTQEQMATEKTGSELNLAHAGFALGLSFLICAVSAMLAEQLGVGGYSIMFITALALLVANLFPRQLAKLKGDYEIGIFFMYVFFAAVGISADIAAMLNHALILGVFTVVIMLCHALVIFAGSRLLRVELMEVAIASNACYGGPASAAALAAGKGRPDLVAPAVLLGVFGYAIANFIGIGLAALLAG